MLKDECSSSSKWVKRSNYWKSQLSPNLIERHELRLENHHRIKWTMMTFSFHLLELLSSNQIAHLYQNQCTRKLRKKILLRLASIFQATEIQWLRLKIGRRFSNRHSLNNLAMNSKVDRLHSSNRLELRHTLDNHHRRLMYALKHRIGSLSKFAQNIQVDKLINLHKREQTPWKGRYHQRLGIV